MLYSENTHKITTVAVLGELNNHIFVLSLVIKQFHGFICSQSLSVSVSSSVSHDRDSLLTEQRSHGGNQTQKSKDADVFGQLSVAKLNAKGGPIKKEDDILYKWR